MNLTLGGSKMGDKPKTSTEMAEKELSKKEAKSIANRLYEIKKHEAEIKKINKQIEKIKSGELVPDEGSISTNKDEDDDSSSLKVIFLLDESGSMSSCKNQTISGFNEYTQTLQKEKKKISVSLTKFNSYGVNIVYSNVPVSNVQPLTNETYQPNGNTPLYDAIGKTVNKDKENKKTLFIILTDGEENSSKEYQKDAIVNLIKEQEKTGWSFVYLGADQNAWGHAQGLGLHVGNVMSYDSGNTEKMYSCLAGQTIGYARSSGMHTKNFFGEDTSGTTKKKPKRASLTYESKSHI
jgi:uncharacterized protein YegL